MVIRSGHNAEVISSRDNTPSVVARAVDHYMLRQRMNEKSFVVGRLKIKQREQTTDSAGDINGPMWKTPGEEACSPLLFSVLFRPSWTTVKNLLPRCVACSGQMRCRLSLLPVYIFSGILHLRSRRAHVRLGYLIRVSYEYQYNMSSIP